MCRLPAEWEEQECVMLTFPHEKSDWICCLSDITRTYLRLIDKISQYQKCVVICDNTDRVKSLLESKNIRSKNILLIQMKTNDTWIRDYGAIDIKCGEKTVSYDFTFNGWGEKFDASLDNEINKKLYEKSIFSNKLISFDFVLEGGSIDGNGEGVMLTTQKCLLEQNRNAHLTKEQIEDFLKEKFYLRKIISLKHGYISGDDTDSHVDTLARFLNKNTIVYVKCDDKEDEHFKELSKMEYELRNSGFDLVPLPLPKVYCKETGERLPATYINFLFINNAIIVPQYNVPEDKNVIKTFKSFYRNRAIIPLDATTLIREHGSIHCATINKWAKVKAKNI